MAATPRRDGRVGSYVGRQVKHGQLRFARPRRNADRYARARRQALPRAKLPRSLGLHGGNYAVRKLDSTTEEEGD